MKKIGLFVLGCSALMGFSSVSPQAQVKTQEDLVLKAEETISPLGLPVRMAASKETVKVSETMVQYGVNENENKVLRFATAVYGDFLSLNYHVSVEGYNEGNEIVTEVKTVYKGVESEGKTLYYNGTGTTEVVAESEGWYWACYTIEFASVKYYAANVNAYLTAVGSVTEEVVSEKKEAVNLTNELIESGTLAKLSTDMLGVWKGEADSAKGELTLTFTETTLTVVNEDGNTISELVYSQYNGDAPSVSERYYVFNNVLGHEVKARVTSSGLYVKANLGDYSVNKYGTNSDFSKYVPATSIKLSFPSGFTADDTLVVGGPGTTKGYVTLQVSKSPANATDAEKSMLVWTSSDETIAIVNQGTITAVGEGIVTITATTPEGVTDSIQVKSRKQIKVTSISFDKEEVDLEKGSKLELSPIVLPSNADNKTLKWTSSNSKVVSVSRGVVTAVSDSGSALITCTSDDGSKVEGTIKVNAKAASGAFKNNEFVGTFTGQDSMGMGAEGTILVSNDGTATFDDDYGTHYEFYLEREDENSKTAYFVNDDGNKLEINIGASFYFVTLNEGEMTDSWTQYDGAQFVKE